LKDEKKEFMIYYDSESSPGPSSGFTETSFLTSATNSFAGLKAGI
jgi:hypothetical protein